MRPLKPILIACFCGLAWLSGAAVAYADGPDMIWAPGPVLTQDRPDCVGTALHTLLVSAPNPRPAPDPVTIYTQAQRWHGLAPSRLGGAWLDDGLAWLQSRGQITAWQRAPDVPGAATWLHDRGPVVLSGDWVQGWSWVDSTGLAGTWGPVVMHHVFVCYGTAGDGRWWLCQNSWGPGWGQAGRFRLAAADVPGWLRKPGADDEIALVSK